MKGTIAISSLVIAAGLLSHPASAADDSWQEKILFSPTLAQLAREHFRDRITIYHGLRDVQVMQAMDQQFDRIEHMMFTGTLVTDDEGQTIVDPDTDEALVEDDGC